MELPDLIDLVRGSVVQITYTIAGLTDARLRELPRARGAVWSVPLGTGFVVSEEGLVVTAKHVVDEVEKVRTRVPEGNHFVGVGFAHSGDRRGMFRVIKYNVIAVDARNDTALLRLRDNPFTMPEEERLSSEGDPFHLGAARLQTSRPRDGDAIAIAGYPLAEPVLVTTAGHVASAWSVDFENVLIPNGQGGYEPVDVTDRYLADVQTNPGNSGGPAFALSDGSVVGMLVQARLTGQPNGTNANIGVLIPSATIADFVLAHGVPASVVA